MPEEGCQGVVTPQSGPDRQPKERLPTAKWARTGGLKRASPLPGHRALHGEPCDGRLVSQSPEDFEGADDSYLDNMGMTLGVQHARQAGTDAANLRRRSLPDRLECRRGTPPHQIRGEDSKNRIVGTMNQGFAGPRPVVGDCRCYAGDLNNLVIVISGTSNWPRNLDLQPRSLMDQWRSPAHCARV